MVYRSGTLPTTSGEKSKASIKTKASSSSSSSSSSLKTGFISFMLTTKIKSSNKINSFLYESYKNKLFDTMFFALFLLFLVILRLFFIFMLFFDFYAYLKLNFNFSIFYDMPAQLQCMGTVE
jgi:hypothetical protein